MNLYEWEGVAGRPAVKGDNGAVITLENLAEFDMRQTDSAIEYIKKHAKDSKPFFMDVNFMKLHQPTSPNKMFAGKSHLGDYSDSVLELDYNIGRIMDVIRAEAPDTIVIFTADNGAWQDAWPDAGTHPYRGEKCGRFRAGSRIRIVGGWLTCDVIRCARSRTLPRTCALGRIREIQLVVPDARKAREVL